MTESSHINIAFVGCGGIAQTHWRGIQTHAPQLKVTAAVDIDPTLAVKMAEQTGGQAFTSLEVALEQGDFEAVDIMLPHNLHEEAATLAFAVGKHVILEKPMATTLDSCDRILAAARETGTVFMIAEQSQYARDVVKVQQLIQEGAIGETITARAVMDERIHRKGNAHPWRFSKSITGGGICVDGGLHWIRPLRMWLGEIDEVVAVLGYPVKDMEGESLAHAIFRFTSGKIAVFEALVAEMVDAPNEKFRITGTEGIIVIEKGHGRRALLYNDEHPRGCEILTQDELRESAYGLELADFARAVLEGAPLAAGPEVSLGDLRTAFAMYRSADSGQWEKVWD
ncbi:MAG: Gfo/Idh/MocA family oxidoreductase [Anaerolineae bacterium]|nr:Gfo/Idh/MocA family oxidoreductase [Anaerolineae bacterium]